MEAASTESILAIKTFASPASVRVISSKTLHLSFPFPRPNLAGFRAVNCFSTPTHNPRNGGSVLSLARCSTTPKSDEQIENSTVELDSDSDVQKPAIPNSNQPLFCSNSSFFSGLVFDLGTKGSWDSAEIGSPVVKRYLGDEEERWYMWYYGRSSEGEYSLDSIGLATSSNGIHWERGLGPASSSVDVGVVLNCSNDWWAFDTRSVRPCDVVIMSSAKVRSSNAVYWLYYAGSGTEKVECSDYSLRFCKINSESVGVCSNESEDGKCQIFRSLPGLAMSQDGRHWARIEGEHHSGALLDVGAAGEWDSMFIASPQVVFHGNGDLRMYYHSFDVEKGCFAVGIARSRDGIRWVKLGKIMDGGGAGAFDECGIVNARVVRNRRDGKYLMVYEGVAADGGGSIGLAISADGLKDWRRLQEGPLLVHAEADGWDNQGVGSPCLIQMDGDDDWRLYYKGIGRSGQMGIGMAVSEGRNIRSFRRWTGFHV